MRSRESVVSALADRLIAVEIGHPLRVGVDGPCGSGKSTLAAELVREIGSRGRSAVHLDSDGFHHLREIRHGSSRGPARVYYEAAYDFDSLVERVLLPLGPGGSRAYSTKIHDMTTDRVVTDEAAVAADDAIVVFDCTFLQRGSLRDHWDEVIYLEVRRDIALARGVARDAGALGGEAGARQAYEDRYMAACDPYVREERPAERASIVIDHDDLCAPRVLRGLEVHRP